MNLAGVTLQWSLAAPVLLPAQDVPPGTPSLCHGPACPAVTLSATHNWRDQQLASRLTRFRWIMLCI